MVGITITKNPVLADLDQMDILGLTDREYYYPLDMLQAKVRQIQSLLHPDKLVNLPPGHTLPYSSVQANALADFLRQGLLKPHTGQPDSGLIWAYFWRNATINHRVRWRPFHSDGRPRSALEIIAPTLRAPLMLAAGPAEMPSTGRVHERERRPYSATFISPTMTEEQATREPAAQEETTADQTAFAQSAPESSEHQGSRTAVGTENNEASRDERLTAHDESIKRVASGFMPNKLFLLAQDARKHKFAFARMKVHEEAGQQRWALVIAQINTVGAFDLSLCNRDIDVDGNVVLLRLSRRSWKISWERMEAAGWFGLGRFQGATKDDVRRYARICSRRAARQTAVQGRDAHAA